MTLGDFLRSAAERGELKHLTLAKSNKGWQGACRGEKDDGYSIHITDEPEAALIGAILKRCPELDDGPEPEDLL